MSEEELVLYDLASSLGMPVYKLIDEMPFEEFNEWIEYYNRRPYQWRDDLRTFHVVRGFGDKRKPDQIFPSLVPIFTEANREKSTKEMLRGSSLLNFIRMAKDGEQLGILEEL